ncbi:30S ribosomal protein S8 [Candidatus Gracilibacteria bacterium]|nr:30S ribosomal protein S8 [Candidatus Gracilibacteria bacterium]MCF7856627.1 30S ribosomal protein S8 [Candidatus Gracilibacteria bacterium]MCF7896927.1 30S ribosomal protein S8 [Candidatus Gracilibacteria bacterium]
MTTDPIADMLTRLRNAQQARKPIVRLPFSKQKFAILKVLEAQKFIEKVSEKKDAKFPEIEVELKTDSKFQFNRISKPGRRVYSKSADIKTVLNDLGIAVVSTSAGFLTNREAHAKKLGGEIICEVY